MDYERELKFLLGVVHRRIINPSRGDFRIYVNLDTWALILVDLSFPGDANYLESVPRVYLLVALDESNINDYFAGSVPTNLMRERLYTVMKMHDHVLEH